MTQHPIQALYPVSTARNVPYSVPGTLWMNSLSTDEIIAASFAATAIRLSVYG